jgi:hypothetical protein
MRRRAAFVAALLSISLAACGTAASSPSPVATPSPAVTVVPSPSPTRVSTPVPTWKPTPEPTPTPSPAGLSIDQAAGAYLAVANRADGQLAKLTFYTAAALNEAVSTQLADEQGAKAILLDAQSQIMLIAWPDSAASEAADVVTQIDKVVSTIDADTEGKYFFLFDFAMGGGSELRTAANALRTQLGLPLTPRQFVPPL